MKITFADLVNVDILQCYYRLLTRLFGLHFSLIDPETWEYLPSFGKNDKSKLNPFCLLINSDLEGAKRCEECNKLYIGKCMQTREMCIYQCHAGLVDITVPIRIEDKVVAVLICGQILDIKPSEDTWKKTLRACKDLRIDLEQLRQHYFNTPVILPHQQGICQGIWHAAGQVAQANARTRLSAEKLQLSLSGTFYPAPIIHVGICGKYVL